MKQKAGNPTEQHRNGHPFLKLIWLLCLLPLSAVSFAQPYDAPYDIPRFQNFIGECKLQAPTSSTAATQSELIAGYTSSWFYVADVDKVAFNQSGSSRRTELRDLRNWTLSQGDRSLHGRIDIVQQTCDQVTVMQIHDDANAGNGPNKPLLRIYKHQAKTPADHLWAAIKTDASGQVTTHVDLGPDPGGYFNCDIKLVGGNLIVDLDGVEKVNMDVSFWTFPSYWKAGVYLQDNGEATAYFDELYTGTPPGNGGGQGTDMYVSSIVTGTLNAGKGQKHGTATVTIVDDTGTPVSGATVTGTFSGTFNESVSGATGGDGTVELVTSATAKGGVSVDLCVDDVTHSTLVYNSGLNVMTCSGSSSRIRQSIESRSLRGNILVVYPNPSIEALTVELTLDEASLFRGRMISVEGKVLRTIPPQFLSAGIHQVEVDVAHLQAGIYFLESFLNGEQRISRVIKK